MDASSSPSEATLSANSSRRTFLVRAAAFGVVPLALGLLVNQQRDFLAPAMKAAASGAPPLGLDRFVPLIGSTFVAAATPAGPALRLVLAKADALKHHRPGVAEQFSLRFIAPAGHSFDSRIYQLEHPALGSMELFITAVGSAIIRGEQQNGEAIINFVRRPA
ncbi:MAG: hypothetical protein NTW21_11585 [Verrucomicrobia bacterium]|nr:hypothetical protein [Verrucomicrobiota bacterium]